MSAPSATLKLESAVKSFGGQQCVYSHESRTLACRMRFAVYLPPGCDANNRRPVVYWLSGLTCNETNFIEKAGAQRYAADLGLVLVCPDTSPRDCSLPGDSDAYDFGTGAGFYVDACVAPWSQHYRMHSYVTGELLELVTAELPVRAGWQSISGHSMGGHGALICALRNPGTYRSASAFAPISNPCASPWGRKALTGYLGAAGEHKGDGDDDGNDASAWHRWDATELIRRLGKGRPDGLAAANRLRLLVDQGGSDSFLAQRQLLPENLRTACDEAGVQLEYAEHEGYDHGYYFVASFIGKHLAHHHRALTQDEE